jgi:hypothetical protein
MRGAIRPLPNTPLWRGDQLKAQGQLHLLPLLLSVVIVYCVLFNSVYKYIDVI